MGRKKKTKKTKTTKRTKKETITPPPTGVGMPVTKATEKQLIVYLDVSGYSSHQLVRLYDAVHNRLADKETANHDGHPGIAHPSFMLRTMRYENGELAKLDESEFPPKADSGSALTEPRCPKCGHKATDIPGLCVKETYDASNPIVWDEDTKSIKVESAWHSTENFGDGNGDLSAYCMMCGFETASLEAFGLLDDEWDWD